MKKRRFLLCAIALASIILVLFFRISDARDKKPASRQIFSMDTVMILTAYGPKGESALDAAAAVINNLDYDLNPQEETSTLWTLNRNGQARVSPEILRMLETAQSVYTRTGGALNPATYPLSQAWGFLNKNYRVPEDAEIDALLTAMDFEGIQISGDTVTLPSDTQISFGALAKGLTSQLCVDTIREQGVASALVSLGGNIQTLGLKPDGSRWRVCVQDPLDSGDYLGILNMGEAAAVTSGGYQRYFVQDGVTYQHILDPHTGRPADSDLLSVTIVCPDGLMADALSTALFVLGEEKALDYYRAWGGFEAILVTEDHRMVVTPGLKEYFEPHGDTYTYEILES